MATQDHEQIKAFYDSEYYGAGSHNAALTWHCRKIADKLGDLRGRQVLDVACGTGEWLELFQSKGAEIAGIDLSEKAIAACRAKLPRGEFATGVAEELPFETKRFDVVTCMGSMEHFVDKPAALAEIRRVAKADAQVILLVPNAGFMTRRLGLYGGTNQAKVREDVYDLPSWERLFRDAGFVVESKHADLHPFSVSWIKRGSPLSWLPRGLQAFALLCWPLSWQYQVYHFCHIRPDA